MCLHRIRSEESLCSSPQAHSWNSNDSIGWAQCTRKAEPLGFQQVVSLCSLTQCSATNLFYNTYPSSKRAEHQKVTGFFFYPEVLSCNISEGGENLKEKKKKPRLKEGLSSHWLQQSMLSSGNIWHKYGCDFFPPFLAKHASTTIS